jgi:hypothetical protein
MLDYGSAGYQVNLPDWAEFYNCDSKHLCQQKVNNHEFVAGSSQFSRGDYFRFGLVFIKT